jgi:hypothetical protein
MDAITAETLLLVEGKDELSISSLLLQKIDADYKTKIDIQAKDGGRDLLKAAKAIATVSGFDRLKSFAILVDAEENAAKTHNTWVKFQSQFVADNAVARCAIDFSNCVNGKGKITTTARKDKLALVSYINAHSTNPYSRVAIALEQQASDLFDFDRDSFKALTAFLKNLL